MKPNEQEKINLFSLSKWIKQTSALGYVILLALTLTGCARYGNPIGRTEANYTNIPVAELQEAALYLEQQVKDGNREPDLNTIDGFIMEAPGIQQALRSRAARVHLVQELLDSGHMYEKNDGLIAVLRTNAYKKSGTRRTRDRDALVIISENNDRRLLYTAIQEANNLDPADRSAIEEIFFKARVKTLSIGQRFQGSDGEIISVQ